MGRLHIQRFVVRLCVLGLGQRLGGLAHARLTSPCLQNKGACGLQLQAIQRPVGGLPATPPNTESLNETVHGTSFSPFLHHQSSKNLAKGGGVVYGLNVRDGTSAHTVTAAYDALKGNNITPAFYPRTAVLIAYK